MGVRILKGFLGALILMSFISEYSEVTKKTGPSFLILAVVALGGLLGLLLIYSSIQNKPFLSYFKKK